MASETTERVKRHRFARGIVRVEIEVPSTEDALAVRRFAQSRRQAAKHRALAPQAELPAESPPGGLVPTIAGSRVVIRRVDASDPLGDRDHADAVGTASAASAGREPRRRPEILPGAWQADPGHARSRPTGWLRELDGAASGARTGRHPRAVHHRVDADVCLMAVAPGLGHQA